MGRGSVVGALSAARDTEQIAARGLADDGSATAHDPELHAVAQLGADALRRRWRSLIGGSVPPGLGRTLVLRMLAYRQQAQRFGDLALVTQRALAASLMGEPVAGASAMVEDETATHPSALVESVQKAGTTRLPSPRVPPLLVPPGTVLVREHAGTLHRVMVLADGFAWNGKTFESLTKVALAITGTHWNGPRFFGLRSGKQKRADDTGAGSYGEDGKNRGAIGAPRHRGVAAAGVGPNRRAASGHSR